MDNKTIENVKIHLYKCNSVVDGFLNMFICDFFVLICIVYDFEDNKKKDGGKKKKSQ